MLLLPLLATPWACRVDGTTAPEPSDPLVLDADTAVEPPCASFAAGSACAHAPDDDLDCLHDGSRGGTDCDDADPSVGACPVDTGTPCVATGREACNGVDDDCDGEVDDVWLLRVDRPAVAAVAGLLGEGRAPLLVLGLAGEGDQDGALEVYDAEGELVVRVEGTGQSPSFGSQLATGRDLTGDGVDDLVVAAPYATTPLGANNGRVVVLPGPLDAQTTLNLAAGWFDGGELDGQPGAQLALLPDLDGDGRDELAVGYYRHVVVFSGAPRPAAGLADALAVVELNTGGGAWHFATRPDATGDGLPELLLGMDTYAGGTGIVAQVASSTLSFSVVASDPAWPGLGQGLVTVDGDTWSLSEGTPVRLGDFATLDVTGSSLGDGGDLDGDGLPELLVGDGSALWAYALTGSPLGKVASGRLQSSRGLVPPTDLDGDGVGDPLALGNGAVAALDGALAFALGCDADADGTSAPSGDCDDDASATYPLAPDTCDGADNDCDGLVDGPADLELPAYGTDVVVFDPGGCEVAPSGWLLSSGEAVAFGEHEGARLSGLSHVVHGGASGPSGAAVLLGHAAEADLLITPSASGSATEVAWASILDAAALTRSGDLGPLGDVDGDGLGDVWVRAVDSAGVSTIALFDGPLHGALHLDQAPWLSVLPSGWTTVVVPTDRAGADLDGDGRADVIVGAPDSYYGWGRLAVATDLPTGSSALDEVATVHLFGEPDERLASSIAVGMDIDGDGIDDALLGADGHLRTLTGGACPALSGRVEGHGGKALLADLDADGRGEPWSVDGEFLYRGSEPVRRATAAYPAGDGAIAWLDGATAWVLLGR